MKKIAIYGKGGIGKSTTVSNVWRPCWRRTRAVKYSSRRLSRTTDRRCSWSITNERDSGARVSSPNRSINSA